MKEMTINERIKFIRKSPELNKTEKMTQEIFGLRIGLKKNTVSTIENGKSSVTDRMIKSICREFSVSEEWLRDGTGEPFIKVSRNEEIAAFVDEVMKEKTTESFRARFVSVLSRLTFEEWQILEKRICEMFPDESGADQEGTELPEE